MLQGASPPPSGFVTDTDHFLPVALGLMHSAFESSSSLRRRADSLAWVCLSRSCEANWQRIGRVTGCQKERRAFKIRLRVASMEARLAPISPDFFRCPPPPTKSPAPVFFCPQYSLYTFWIAKGNATKTHAAKTGLLTSARILCRQPGQRIAA